jgi:hypothetical protein
MGVSAAELALGKALGRTPTIQWPIQLTPKAPFHVGMAALVFAGPHVLSPADDFAEFGYPNPNQQEAKEGGFWFYPPYEGARIVVWFRPPELDRKYNIDFSCDGGEPGGPFILESSDGNTETVEVPQGPGNVAYPTAHEHVSSTFLAGGHEWRSFTLSCSTYWRFSYCELNVLP